MEGIRAIRAALDKRKDIIKGICRGLTFVFTASLAVSLLKPQMELYTVVIGGLTGFFAYCGW